MPNECLGRRNVVGLYSFYDRFITVNLWIITLKAFISFLINFVKIAFFDNFVIRMLLNSICD